MIGAIKIMKIIRKLFQYDFIRFCFVGGIGFLINLALLTLLYKTIGLPILLSQFIAAEISLFNNFILHHKWTYKHKKVTKSITTLIVQFHVTSWVAIIGSTVIVSFCVGVLGWNYILALILASAVALFWNFAWTKYAIWRNRDEVPASRLNDDNQAKETK